MKNRHWPNLLYRVSTLVLLVGGVYGAFVGKYQMVAIAVVFLAASTGAGVWRLNLMWDEMLHIAREEREQ